MAIQTLHQTNSPRPVVLIILTLNSLNPSVSVWILVVVLPMNQMALWNSSLVILLNRLINLIDFLAKIFPVRHLVSSASVCTSSKLVVVRSINHRTDSSGRPTPTTACQPASCQPSNRTSSITTRSHQPRDPISNGRSTTSTVCVAWPASPKSI